MATQDKFEGCLLGLAYGDALCAPYEGGSIERLLWRMIGKTKAGELRFTDDTQMALDVANSILCEGDLNQDKLAMEFAESYRWSRGYGAGASKLLKSIRKGAPWHEANVSIFKEGSFGNGAAMRAPVLALSVVRHRYGFREKVIRSAEITHSHELAIEGALLVAYSTLYALADIDSDSFSSLLKDQVSSVTYKTKLEQLENLISADIELSLVEVRKTFGNRMTAEGSCVTAIYLALRYRKMPFIELVQFVKRLGGDTDTIAAMACAIWGAFNGVVKMQIETLPRVEMQSEIQQTAVRLYQAMEDETKLEKEVLREPFETVFAIDSDPNVSSAGWMASRLSELHKELIREGVVEVYCRVDRTYKPVESEDSFVVWVKQNFRHHDYLLQSLDLFKTEPKYSSSDFEAIDDLECSAKSAATIANNIEGYKQRLNRAITVRVYCKESDNRIDLITHEDLVNWVERNFVDSDVFIRSCALGEYRKVSDGAEAHSNVIEQPRKKKFSFRAAFVTFIAAILVPIEFARLVKNISRSSSPDSHQVETTPALSDTQVLNVELAYLKAGLLHYRKTYGSFPEALEYVKGQTETSSAKFDYWLEGDVAMVSLKSDPYTVLLKIEPTNLQ